MIRFAEENDIKRIMNFIDTYWKKGHILGTNEPFFRYEHLLDEGVTYAIAENDAGDIEAILGYIPYGNKNRDIMTVMWKANHTADPSLGLNLFKFLKDEADVRIMASPGSNPKLKGLYSYLGYQFGKMVQWYRLRELDDYSVAKIADKTIPGGDKSGEFVRLDTWESVMENFDFDGYTKESKPYKEAWYIKKRYFDHPIYDYDVYGLMTPSGKVGLMMIFRIIKVNGINVVRLIDCIGNFALIKSSTGLLDKILTDYDAEYVDCYETGLPESYMKESGWMKTEGSGNIIPNYFAPFTQENIDIYYFSSDPETVLFKGDGDQDRPN